MRKNIFAMHHSISCTPMMVQCWNLESAKSLKVLFTDPSEWPFTSDQLNSYYLPFLLAKNASFSLMTVAQDKAEYLHNIEKRQTRAKRNTGKQQQQLLVLIPARVLSAKT